MSWDHLKVNIHTKWKAYWFATHPQDVAEYSWNYLFTGGKEIRPTLFCELWSYLSPDQEVCGELGFVVECIHVASLVLDDTPWMDNAEERRGRTTLHKVFSPKKALLIVSELMDIARYIWRSHRPPHVSEDVWHGLLLSKLKMLAVGQLCDLEKKGTLIELASFKTGVLFELVTETVAMCVNLDTEFWKVWGRSLGILFQWMDDWQDREEDSIQQNRNAFLESYDDTLSHYHRLWRKLKTEISTSWFSRPFGIFMTQYFTEGIPMSKEDIGQDNTFIECKNVDYVHHMTSFAFESATLLSGVPLPVGGITGKNIIRRIFRHSTDLFTLPSLRTYLWDIDETEWDSLPEIQELLRASSCLP